MSSGSANGVTPLVERVGLLLALREHRVELGAERHASDLPALASRSRITTVSPGADDAQVMRRGLRARLRRVHRVAPAVHDEFVKARP